MYQSESKPLLELVKRKGVYPYSYFDSYERFSETSLPPKSSFHNDLSNEDISDSDYEHALEGI